MQLRQNDHFTSSTHDCDPRRGPEHNMFLLCSIKRPEANMKILAICGEATSCYCFLKGSSDVTADAFESVICVG